MVGYKGTFPFKMEMALYYYICENKSTVSLPLEKNVLCNAMT